MRKRTTFLTPFALVRYEQQQGVGLATPKYVMMRRGILASDAQRKPGIGLSATAKPEVATCLCALHAVTRAPPQSPMWRCVSKHDGQNPTACPSRRLSEAAA